MILIENIYTHCIKDLKVIFKNKTFPLNSIRADLANLARVMISLFYVISGETGQMERCNTLGKWSYFSQFTV